MPNAIGCLTKIVSGGQTGADRAGFEAAREVGLAIGGWAPRGWRAEDGCIPLVYRQFMRESVSPDYKLRTRLNVQDSDGYVGCDVCRPVRIAEVKGLANQWGFDLPPITTPPADGDVE